MRHRYALLDDIENLIPRDFPRNRLSRAAAEWPDTFGDALARKNGVEATRCNASVAQKRLMKRSEIRSVSNGLGDVLMQCGAEAAIETIENRSASITDSQHPAVRVRSPNASANDFPSEN